MIYTSYFGNMKKLDKDKCVAICRWVPRWYNGKQYIDVAPTVSILRKWKDGPQDREAMNEYIREYQKQVLETLDPQKIRQDLDGKILLCYEKTGDFCHRHLLSDWLNQHGIPCHEWWEQKSESPKEMSLF